MYGAIDLGGTKIEACLFDESLNPIEKKRIPTPHEDYGLLINAILSQCAWLEERAAQKGLPIGIGIPGLIDRETGKLTTANLPAMGKTLRSDLINHLGRQIAVENDCKCFALSESQGGAGEGYQMVFGLILGTGAGGGVALNGELMLHHNGIAGEIGHFALPANLVKKYELPVLKCGCGRTGCYETLVSGPGMRRLCTHLTGHERSTTDIANGFINNNQSLRPVYEIWLELVCELMLTIQLVADPDCIVLGGGLSRIEGLDEQLRSFFPPHQLSGVRPPIIRIARFGDSSGVRGAAILAKRQRSRPN